MSEKKRFEIVELYGDTHLIDNETDKKIGYDLHSPSTFNENWNNVCDTLNKLHEQNQNLKFLNNKYAKENKSLKVIRNSLKGIKKHIDLLSDDGVIE